MEYPVLPKNRLEVHECLKYLTVETNKGEDVLSFNDFESGIIIFTCAVPGAGKVHTRPKIPTALFSQH